MGIGRSRVWHPTEGRSLVVSPGGDVVFDSGWRENVWADEGEESVLNVYFRELANPAKHLCLIEGGTTPPTETSTMAYLGGGAGAREVRVPGVDGYNRQQILAADWGAPALDAGDMQTQAAQKTFGPFTAAVSGITHVGLVTAATGQLAGSGKFLGFVALGSAASVPSGFSYLHTHRVRCQ